MSEKSKMIYLCQLIVPLVPPLYQLVVQQKCRNYGLFEAIVPLSHFFTLISVKKKINIIIVWRKKWESGTIY